MSAKLKHIVLLLTACWVFILPPMPAMAGTECTVSQLIQQDVCDNTEPITQHIFSWVACSFVEILNSVLTQVYCAMLDGLAPIAGVLMTAYVMLLGLQMLMGTVQFTAKEVTVRLVKLGLVSMFISNSTFGIETAFQFFVDVSNEGSQWVLGTIQFAGSGDDVPSTYGYLDNLVYSTMLNPLTQPNATLFKFLFGLGIVFPPAFYLSVYWVIENLIIIGRCLLMYMLGLAALAFLIAMSPIFVSMMLFQSTYYLFETWLKYMISYSLQIVIVFACVAMWLSVTDNFIGFFDILAQTLNTSSFIATPGNEATLTNTWQYCQHDPNQLITMGEHTLMVQCTGGFQPLTNMPNDALYTYMLVYNLMTLLILTFAFSALIQRAPEFAQQLAGPEYVPSLASGFGFTKFGQLQRMTQGGKSESIMPNTGALLRGNVSNANSTKQYVDNVRKAMQNIRN